MLLYELWDRLIPLDGGDRYLYTWTFFHIAMIAAILLFTAFFMRPRLTRFRGRDSVMLRILAISVVIGYPVSFIDMTFARDALPLGFRATCFAALQLYAILSLPVLYWAFVLRKKQVRAVFAKEKWQTLGVVAVYGVSCCYAFENLRKLFVFLRVSRFDLAVKKSAMLFPDYVMVVEKLLGDAFFGLLDWLSTWLLHPDLFIRSYVRSFFGSGAYFCIFAFLCIYLFRDKASGDGLGKAAQTMGKRMYRGSAPDLHGQLKEAR